MWQRLVTNVAKAFHLCDKLNWMEKCNRIKRNHPTILLQIIIGEDSRMIKLWLEFELGE